jgi:hypothetical protein
MSTRSNEANARSSRASESTAKETLPVPASRGCDGAGRDVDSEHVHAATREREGFASRAATHHQHARTLVQESRRDDLFRLAQSLARALLVAGDDVGVVVEPGLASLDIGERGLLRELLERPRHRRAGRAQPLGDAPSPEAAAREDASPWLRVERPRSSITSAHHDANEAEGAAAVRGLGHDGDAGGVDHREQAPRRRARAADDLHRVTLVEAPRRAPLLDPGPYFAALRERARESRCRHRRGRAVERERHGLGPSGMPHRVVARRSRLADDVAHVAEVLQDGRDIASAGG